MYAWPEQQARHHIDERIREAAGSARGSRIRRRTAVNRLTGWLGHHERPAASPVD